jgi:chromosome segregation ATPase
VIRRTQLAERRAQAVATVRKLTGELERAKAEDSRKAGEALAADPGRKLPQAQAPRVQQRLDEARRELQAVEQALERATRDVLRAGMGIAADLHGDLVNRIQTLEGEIETLLAQALEAGAVAGDLENQAHRMLTVAQAQDPR